MNIELADIQQQVALALKEDIGNGDVTANLLPAEQNSSAKVITRESGILCGTHWFDQCFLQIDNKVKINWQCQDGDTITTNQTLCTIDGPTRALLSAERTALNFLQTLSATASITRHYVDALANTNVKVLDTRKTIPGLRKAQKYAVFCGGGMNHRIGLYDMILIKENHIASCGSITAAIKQAQQNSQDCEIEIEVESLDELEQALDAGAERILLDNFAREDLIKAVALNQQRAKLEVSGNITLENINEVAQTGIDYISSGAITKNIQALDFSLLIKSDK
ncbi:Quinolinate phosphoribosyltransferase [decarboxylating] [hydrothermal vent metagenome]|uniref:Probable nicotinate-nucleotide pyrophosphorylase [carboxylating] n=1 Tax=hydrothermal vent metagenome TaxID=652676 RepID=A0A3B1AFY1_9ZZZZ